MNNTNETADLKEKVKQLFRLKMKFAMTGLVATAVDYALYLFLVYTWFNGVVSNIISYSVAVVINYSLQKRYIFKLERKASVVFALTLLVSLGGLAFSTGMIYALTRMEFFRTHQYLTKMVATATVFFYNFYLKRFAFERKFF